MNIILCIDDTPERYMRFPGKLKEAGIVPIISCRKEEADFYFDNSAYNIMGICLDHDMPYGDGKYFARDVIPDYYPVAITSVNTVGADAIEKILKDRGIVCKKTPGLIGFEDGVFAFFEQNNEKFYLLTRG